MIENKNDMGLRYFIFFRLEYEKHSEVYYEKFLFQYIAITFRDVAMSHMIHFTVMRNRIVNKNDRNINLRHFYFRALISF